MFPRTVPTRDWGPLDVVVTTLLDVFEIQPFHNDTKVSESTTKGTIHSLERKSKCFLIPFLKMTLDGLGLIKMSRIRLLCKRDLRYCHKNFGVWYLGSLEVPVSKLNKVKVHTIPIRFS